MFSMKDNRFRDLSLLLLGIFGVLWFFYSYPIHHPLGNTDLEYSRDEILAKADSVYLSWQFQPQELPDRIHAESYSKVLDSLQQKWLDESPREIKNKTPFLQHFPFYYWAVNKYSRGGYGYDEVLQFEMSAKGKVISFFISNDLINDQLPYNRTAIRYVFSDQGLDITRVVEDSLIQGLVNYQHLGEGGDSYSRSQEIIDNLRKLHGGKSSEVYTMDNIWKLTDFYIQKTIWNKFEIEKDSVELLNEAGIRFARTFLHAEDSGSEVRVNLIMDVLPGGSLKKLDVSVTPQKKTEDPGLNLVETIGLLILLCFFIWLLIAFYLRIKARAIDTHPALIIAVIAGFIAPGFTMLQFAADFGITKGVFDTSDIINGLLVVAVTGAISAIGFFVLTAVSDSITRQYWPEKLDTWDFVRRGIVRNKPVGWVLINALSIGGILIGIYSLLIAFLPGLYLESNISLVSDNYVFSSVGNLMVSTFICLLMVVTVFLIISNQLVGLSGRKWIIPMISGLLFVILDMVRISINPMYIEVIVNFMIGAILGLFYLRYDFLTIALGFFIYVNLERTAQGWLIANSPDANTFYMFAALLGGLLLMGISFILKGTEGEQLPEYVPGYIEDQAKEQRLKQELSIARIVQQTFLPSKFEHLPGIDIAGICVPAQETGGDYYDMISLGKTRTAIAIGDVSGKGIRAAFYMTFTKGVLHSLSAIVMAPVELLNQLNRLFYENATRGTFITMIYGILEAEKRTFTYARAGHNPMLLIKQNGDSEWLKPKGIGVGVAKGDKFITYTEEHTLKLKEGDVLVLYTDGITEMMNSSRHFYGEEKLERLVRGVKKASSEKILEIIIDNVNEFKGVEKQHDDMTVIVIKADTSANQ